MINSSNFEKLVKKEKMQRMNLILHNNSLSYVHAIDLM